MEEVKLLAVLSERSGDEKAGACGGAALAPTAAYDVFDKQTPGAGKHDLPLASFWGTLEIGGAFFLPASSLAVDHFLWLATSE